MRHLTIRNIPADLASALEREKKLRSQSLNQTVKDLLRLAVGLAPDRSYDNGLGAFAGTWTGADLEEFESATKPFSRPDEGLWR